MRALVVKGPGYERAVEILRERGVEIRLADPSDVDEEAVLRDIRSIPPQVRGRVRKGGRGNPLPISRTGRLNWRRTAIVVLYDDGGRPIDVYPKQLGGRYVGLEEGLGAEVRSLYEEPIVALLAQNPGLLGCERLVSMHTVLGDREALGEADLVLRCKGRTLVVEVEETAGERAVWQCVRLVEEYSKMGVEADCVIVGFGATPAAVRLARERGIRVYRVCLEELWS